MTQDTLALRKVAEAAENLVRAARAVVVEYDNHGGSDSHMNCNEDCYIGAEMVGLSVSAAALESALAQAKESK